MNPDTERRLLNAGCAIIALVILIILLLFVSRPAHGAQLAGSSKRTVKATWDFNYTAWPACSSAKTNCVSGFQFGIWNGHTCSDLATSPNPPNANGQVNGIKATFIVTAPRNEIFCLAATWIDYAGSTQLAAPAIEGQPTSGPNTLPAGRVSGLKIEK